MKLFKNLIAVLFFAIIGGAGRLLLMKLFPTSGILLANVVGCFLLGGLVAYLSIKPFVPEWLSVGLKIGLLGTFTTFSSAMGTIYNDIAEGGMMAAGLYGFSSVVGGVAAAALAMMLLPALVNGKRKEQD